MSSSVVHGSPSSQEPRAGQASGLPAGAPVSQVSPGSRFVLPQAEEQSGSVRDVAPAGQQWSPAAAVSIRLYSHVSWHPAPTGVSSVQATWSSQLTGGQ